MLLDHSLSLSARGARLCAESAALRAHSAELRQRGAFNSRRVKRLRNRSADLATIVLFRENLPRLAPSTRLLNLVS